MGVEGYILASALKAIIAQRLVRKICEHCIEETVIEETQQSWLMDCLNANSQGINFKHGKGCPHCNQTGYSGRIGVYELLEMNHQTLDALRHNDSAAFTQAAKNTAGFKSFSESALNFVRQGITTLDEVIRITGSGV
jgi:MSHA biogenesis protein MshE